MSGLGTVWPSVSESRLTLARIACQEKTTNPLGVTLSDMDALEQFDLAQDVDTTPEQKLGQALETMAEGLQLKRRVLQVQHPELDEAEIEQAFQHWLFSEDDI
jgi:hypothetical protein